MLNLLRNLYAKAEEYKGRRLIKLLTTIFVLFLVLGLSIGYVVGQYSEISPTTTVNVTQRLDETESFEGTITFIEPFLHPEDEISYVLVDSAGNDIILLKAKDQKLEVSEGHYATVYGEKLKTVTGEDYLLVDRVAIKSTE